MKFLKLIWKERIFIFLWLFSILFFLGLVLLGTFSGANKIYSKKNSTWKTQIEREMKK